MNKTNLLSTVTMMAWLAAGIASPVTAAAQVTHHRNKVVVNVSVDKHTRWHRVRAHHSSLYFNRDHAWYGYARYFTPYQTHVVRRLLRQQDRRDRWSDLAPRERRILRRDLRRQKTHRRADRAIHRRGYPYVSRHRLHRNPRIGLRLEYDRWL